jgi:hypothetical protein
MPQLKLTHNAAGDGMVGNRRLARSARAKAGRLDRGRPRRENPWGHQDRKIRVASAPSRQFAPAYRLSMSRKISSPLKSNETGDHNYRMGFGMAESIGTVRFQTFLPDTNREVKKKKKQPPPAPAPKTDSSASLAHPTSPNQSFTTTPKTEPRHPQIAVRHNLQYSQKILTSDHTALQPPTTPAPTRATPFPLYPNPNPNPTLPLITQPLSTLPPNHPSLSHEPRTNDVQSTSQNGKRPQNKNNPAAASIADRASLPQNKNPAFRFAERHLKPPPPIVRLVPTRFGRHDRGLEC